MEEAQVPTTHKFDRVLVLMTALCFAAGLIAYFLVKQPSFATNQGVTILENTDAEIPLIDTTQHVSSGEQTNSSPDDVSALRDELTSFDLNLTDVMAPLPMEGVEPAGSSNN